MGGLVLLERDTTLAKDCRGLGLLIKTEFVVLRWNKLLVRKSRADVTVWAWMCSGGYTYIFAYDANIKKSVV
jgi:hypothetical protein